MPKKDYMAELDEMYDWQVPGYIVSAGKSFITLRAAVWEGAAALKYKITVEDVVKYYATQAMSMSGVRMLASFASDWRMVDNMAKECFAWFRRVNWDALVREGKKYGITPRRA